MRGSKIERSLNTKATNSEQLTSLGLSQTEPKQVITEDTRSKD